MMNLERREIVGWVVDAGWCNGGRNGFVKVEDQRGRVHEIWGTGTMSHALWSNTVSPKFPCDMPLEVFIVEDHPNWPHPLVCSVWGCE